MRRTYCRQHVCAGALQVWRVGRWGPCRLPFEHCAGTLRAEMIYDGFCRGRTTTGPGSVLTFEWPGCPETSSISAEVRANRVWRHGRLFLFCPRCRARVTRLYRPKRESDPRCRSCWGLSYLSRSWSYHGLSALTAHVTTSERREERRRAARARYVARESSKSRARAAKHP